jgi:hypothetical protein
MADLSSVEQCITTATSIRPTGRSLHYQVLVDGVVSGVRVISIPWWCKQRNWLVIEVVTQRTTNRKMNILSH